MSDIMSRIQEQFLNKRGQGNAEISRLIAADQKVRQAISELYSSLLKVNDVNVAIELLADHTAILVEMINEFKSRKK